MNGKKLRCGLFCGVVLVANVAQAKEVGNAAKRAEAEEADKVAAARSFEVSLNPLSLVGGGVTASGQFALGSRTSVGPTVKTVGRGGRGGGGGGGRGGNSSSTTAHNVTETKGSSFGVEAYHWMSGNGVLQTGAYISPYLSYGNLSFKDKDTSYETKATQTSFGATGGYGFYGDSGISMKLGIGVGYNQLSGGSYNFTDKTGQAATLRTRGQKGGGPTGDLMLGFAF